MTPNPHRFRASRWLGRRTARLKSLAVIGTATLGLAGLGIAAAGPAAADPEWPYVAVGSEVTQDVMNGFAASVGDGIVASYNANGYLIPVHGILTPKIGCNFTRPNGSHEGFYDLDLMTNQNQAPPPDPPPPPPPPLPQGGCVDIGRSNSPPGSECHQAPPAPGCLLATGNLVYIPFAVDGMTGATGPTTAGQTTTTQCAAATPGCTNVVSGIGTISFTVPVTNITTADMFTLTDLQNLYSCTNITEGGITYNPNTAGAAQQQIDLYAPPPGSPLLVFWATVLAFNPTSPPACVHQTIVAGPANGIQVAENDGSAFASDPNGYGPFSIPQWIAQSNGHVPGPDSRHTAILHNLNGIAPIVSATLNPNFPAPLLREVYNVVEYDRVVPVGAPQVFSFTAFNINPTVFTASGSTYAAGTPVQLTGTGLPPGFMAGTTYFVVNPMGGTFQLAATARGTPINSPSTGQGTVQAVVPFDPALSALLATTGSRLCSSTFTIKSYGFGTLPNPSFPDACGATTNGLRVQENNSTG